MEQEAQYNYNYNIQYVLHKDDERLDIRYDMTAS